MENNKKKILLVSPMLHQGGFERVCVTTARLLQDTYDVTIVIFDDADIAYDVEGLNIVNINRGVKEGKLSKAVNVILRANELTKLKKLINPEVCYSFGVTANRVNCLSKIKGVKTLVGIRGFKDLENEKMTKLYMKYADLIVCCSKEMEHTINQKYSFYKTTNLYNLYDIDKIVKESKGETECPFNKDEHKIMVSMGRDDELKGFWHLIKAFSLVYKEDNSARLMIIGDGEFKECRALVKKLDIENAVYFAGMRKDPYKYIKEAKLYLLTSINEGFPNALVEGMALGLVPIASNCQTGPAEILMEEPDITVNKVNMLLNNKVLYGDYGVITPQFTASPDYSTEIKDEDINYAQVIIDILNNQQLMDKYSKKAVERAHMFTYEAYKKAFINMVEQ